MARFAEVWIDQTLAGRLVESSDGYAFAYMADYSGHPVSLTMPIRVEPYIYDGFPPYFDGLLPEGMMLEALLRGRKLDASDRMGQLLAVGDDVVGAVRVRPA